MFRRSMTTTTNMAAEATSNTISSNSTSGVFDTTLTSNTTSGVFNTTSLSNITSGVSVASASVSSWSPPKPNDLLLTIPLCVATGIVSCIIIGLCCFMKKNNLMPSFKRSKRRSMNVRRTPPLSQPTQEASGASVLTLHKRFSISSPDLLQCKTSSYSYQACFPTKQMLIQIRPPAEKVPNNTEHSTNDTLVDTRLTQNKTFTQKGRDAYVLGRELNMVTSKPSPETNKSDPHIYQSANSTSMKPDQGQFASIGKRRALQARVGQVQLTQLWDQN